MKRLTTVFCLMFFVALFLVASVIFYRQVVHAEPAPIAAVVAMSFMAIAAGIMLAHFLYEAKVIFIERLPFRILWGAGAGVVLFLGVFSTECVLSTMRLARASRDPNAFSVMNGHCGIYSGRGLIRWFKLSLNPSVENRFESFQENNQCRIDHFMDLRRRQQLPCNHQEDPYSCLDRWMMTFAKRGYWNVETRAMFFDEAAKTIKADDEEQEKKWILYAFRDHELQLARPTLMQQAGVDEEFDDLYQYLKTKDVYDNLVMTKKVFDTAESFLGKGEHNPIPERLRFREMKKEVSINLEKIPELEESLKRIQSRISYNPSR